MATTTPQTVGFALLAFIYLLIRYFNRTDMPKIKNLPEVPGVPLFGNLLQLKDQHAKIAGSWVKKYGPVFQVRLGNRRIVFANTFDSVKHLWITHQSSLISRPTLYTFHSIVSSSQGYTIGTSPWDESCKRRRKAAATALNRPAVQSYMPIIDLESNHSIRDLYKDSQNGTIDLDPRAYFQRFALNTSLTLNYGIRISGGIDDSLLREIVHVERIVSNFRSTSNNWQDYIPLLRLRLPFLPSARDRETASYRTRRDVYMNKLLSMLQSRIADGIDKPCITGNILKDPDAKLNEAEIRSIGLTMVSAGIDTIPGNLIMGIAYLSSSPSIQSRAYQAITAVYPNPGDAWHACLHEEKIPYISALVKEILRYFTVIPISLPRTSIKDIPYPPTNSVIPAGTTFYMNAYAADYDPTHFSSPHEFNPERYLDTKSSTSTSDDPTSQKSTSSSSSSGTPHFAYGAGSRMCAGTHLANRELYVAFVRLLAAFEITAPEKKEDEAILDALECNAIPTSLTTEPKYFKVGFRVRDREGLERWMEESDGRTRDL
ncbi:MAG: hypothetical protein Q9227_005971 [Pyrenula ochraceoflavens]